MNTPYVFKRCSKCEEWLVANNINFHKDKNGKFKLKSRCKECIKKMRNKEQEKIRWKKRYSEKRDEILEYNRERYHENIEKERERSRKYHKNNREREKEQRKIYYKNNPHIFFNKCSERRNKLEKQGRGITKEQWNECNNWFDWKCAYSGENLKKSKDTYGRTLDHIIALDNRGLNEPWNIIPMRKGYNASKRNRIDTLTWYKEQEYFDIDRLNKIVEWQIYAYEKWGGEEFGELVLITDLI